MESALTQEILKSILSYDKDTGVFAWKISPNVKVHVGDVAGRNQYHGYREIWYNYKVYKAHRLAWLYEYGEWPPNQIDHINGIKNDNRIKNLRLATPRENSLNKKCHRQGHLVGARFDARRNRWQAHIVINGKWVHIGMFATEQEASAAYLNALHLLSEQEEGVTK